MSLLFRRHLQILMPIANINFIEDLGDMKAALKVQYSTHSSYHFQKNCSLKHCMNRLVRITILSILRLLCATLKWKGVVALPHLLAHLTTSWCCNVDCTDEISISDLWHMSSHRVTKWHQVVELSAENSVMTFF